MMTDIVIGPDAQEHPEDPADERQVDRARPAGWNVSNVPALPLGLISRFR